jgi:hypothetical protein
MQKLNIADVEKFAKYYKKLNMVGGGSKQQRDIYSFKINDYSSRLTQAGIDVNKIAKIIQSGGDWDATLQELDRMKADILAQMVEPADVSADTNQQIDRVGTAITGAVDTISQFNTSTENLIRLHADKLAEVEAEFARQLAAVNARSDANTETAARQLQELGARSAAELTALQQRLDVAEAGGEERAHELTQLLEAARQENITTMDNMQRWATNTLNGMKESYVALSRRYGELANNVIRLRDLPPLALRANLDALQQTIERGMQAAQAGRVAPPAGRVDAAAAAGEPQAGNLGGGGRRRRY